MNRPYETTKVGGSIYDIGENPPPYEKIVYLVVLRNRLCLRREQAPALRCYSKKQPYKQPPSEKEVAVSGGEGYTRRAT